MGATLQQDRCTQNDYVRLFADSAEPLRWLSNTLTGDSDLGEQVFAAALEQSLKGAELVFRDWMISWARRLIIKVCIATVHPAAKVLDSCSCSVHKEGQDSLLSQHLEIALGQPAELLQHKLLRLESLDRFVFVLRALEGYSRHETAILLGIDDRSCESAYLRSVEKVSTGCEILNPRAASSQLLTA